MLFLAAVFRVDFLATFLAAFFADFLATFLRAVLVFLAELLVVVFFLAAVFFVPLEEERLRAVFFVDRASGIRPEG